MKSDFNFQLSNVVRYNQTTYHKGCGGTIVEARLVQSESDPSDPFDESKMWLVCTGVRNSHPENMLMDDFDPKRDQGLCLCINAGVVEKLTYSDAQDQQHSITDELFESFEDGVELPGREPVYGFVEKSYGKNRVTEMRVLTWTEERSYWSKGTKELVERWTEKVKMADPG